MTCDCRIDVIAAAHIALLHQDYEALYPKSKVRRDSTATVIATGEGMGKQLLVNGFGMTMLTPITKMMAHFTLHSSAAAAAQRADHLFRDGHNIPLGDVVGHSGDGGGTGAQRA